MKINISIPRFLSVFYKLDAHNFLQGWEIAINQSDDFLQLWIKRGYNCSHPHMLACVKRFHFFPALPCILSRLENKIIVNRTSHCMGVHTTCNKPAQHQWGLTAKWASHTPVVPRFSLPHLVHRPFHSMCLFQVTEDLQIWVHKTGL